MRDHQQDLWGYRTGAFLDDGWHRLPLYARLVPQRIAVFALLGVAGRDESPARLRRVYAHRGAVPGRAILSQFGGGFRVGARGFSRSASLFAHV